jgi:Na+/phosphate symporter
MFNWYLNQVSKFIQNEKRRILNEESEEYHAILKSTLNNLLIDIRRLDNSEFNRIKEKVEKDIKELPEKEEREMREFKERLKNELEKDIIIDLSSAKADDEKPEFDRSAITKEEN